MNKALLMLVFLTATTSAHATVESTTQLAIQVSSIYSYISPVFINPSKLQKETFQFLLPNMVLI